jgi:hypothetical protein
MDNQTPPPNEFIHLINIIPPNIKKAYKNSKKVKKSTNIKLYKPQKIADKNSKNQKKRKEKQLARQLFKLSKKIQHIL